MDIFKPLLSLFKSIKTIVSILRELSNDWSKVVARAKAAPGFPPTKPTLSQWQDDPPYPELVDIQSPGGLPPNADIVIIGSGISGVSIARSALRELRRKGTLAGRRVIVLEARQLCSGATGRNGGHIKASPHEVFHTLVHKQGWDRGRAARICAFQLSHLDVLTELARAEGIEDVSECREVETVDFAVDEATDERMKGMMEDFLPYAPAGYEMVGHTGEQARERFGVNGRVVGAVSYTAGALSPYRLVTVLWKKLLDEFPEVLAIETGTRVEEVQVNDQSARSSKLEDNSSFPYVVVTSRGQIFARNVVHATNAFTSQLVPGLRGKGTSALCHMTAQRTPGYFPERDGSRSWSVIFGQGFDYVTQRPTGELMIGGGFFQGPKQGMDMMGVYDDSKIDGLTLMHLEGVIPTVFDPGYKVEGEGARVIRAWSGAIGVTPDLMPLVGRLDPRITSRKIKQDAKDTDKVPSGEWISAYFCGDGMVWAWLCGAALGIMLAGSEDEDLPAEPGRPAGKCKLAKWFPQELNAGWERVKGMDIVDLADAL
ncbi:fad dependent oxidoreductase [Diaporthe amygdali]|uniref:fad dependent oxidoreductase n=1 Tax=Phomopsis amygdali TaxID=1214568 RepID=UPI0022FDBB31|nr:fad dependent oxidoreductase [Diaporthe amygdali]KAJ0124593.1 fad dependent oxidoreductase [Diaporthe amygdali]